MKQRFKLSIFLVMTGQIVSGMDNNPAQWSSERRADFCNDTKMQVIALVSRALHKDHGVWIESEVLPFFKRVSIMHLPHDSQEAFCWENNELKPKKYDSASMRPEDFAKSCQMGTFVEKLYNADSMSPEHFAQTSVFERGNILLPGNYSCPFESVGTLPGEISKMIMDSKLSGYEKIVFAPIVLGLRSGVIRLPRDGKPCSITIYQDELPKYG